MVVNNFSILDPVGEMNVFLLYHNVLRNQMHKGKSLFIVLFSVMFEFLFIYPYLRPM